MVLIDNAGGTVESLTRVSSVKDVANREDTMSPFDKEVGSAEVAVAHKGVDCPINVTRKRPVTR